jgi:hypothetical protein
VKKFVLLLSANVLIVVSLFSQERTTSMLVDGFQDASCEVLWARLDGFRSALSNDPSAIATIAISGKIGEIQNDLWIEDMIRGYFRMTGISSDKWKIVRTRPQAERRIEFWISPAGAEPPRIEAAEWSLTYQKPAKPFIFAYEPDHMEDVSVCLPSNGLRLLSNVLQASPNARTNVVLMVRSKKEFERKRRRTLFELVSSYAIQRQQIRIFKQIINKPDPYHIEPEVEYWLVP